MNAAAARRGPDAVLAKVVIRLRPHPHRGDVIAAGAVPLALFAIVVAIRMTQWPLGARFAVVAIIALLLFTMGWLCELEADVPRAYHSALLLSGLLPMIVALELLAELLGAQRPPGVGAWVWTFGVEAGLAGAAAHRANSGACTLLAGLALALAAESFVQWAFQPHGLGTARAILLVLTLAYAAGALRLRDRHRRHAVQLINAAGLLTVLLAASFLFIMLAAAVLNTASVGGLGPYAAPAAFGWKLWILVVGFGLIAYAGADREPAPSYFGVVLLVEFALLVGLPPAGHSLAGWPLFLLLIGAIGVAIGMRPRRPLPPPPAGASDAPTIPLNREDHD